MKKQLSIAVLMGLSTFVLGCTPKYQVHVNGFLDKTHSPAIAGDACIFVVEDEDSENPIFHNEIKQKIQALLTAMGLSLCPPESADLQLLIGYGVDSGRTIQGARMVHEPSHIVTIRRSNSKGGHAYSTIHVPGLTYTVPYSQTVFGHWLKLYLYEVPETEAASTELKPVWIGEITCSDVSSDLREIINPMLVGAFGHFGQNTHQRIREAIPHTDPRVQQLQRH